MLIDKHLSVLKTPTILLEGQTRLYKGLIILYFDFNSFFLFLV